MREEILNRGLAALGLGLNQGQKETLLAYLQLLEKWNRHYNLTAIRDPQEMLAKHVLDSLSIWPYVQGRQILDVGSGAGLPGIPLAIARPEWQFTLLDSGAKKIRFLVQAAIELRLSNLTAVGNRIQDYRPPHLFDTVVTRAFAKLAEFVALAGPLCQPGGNLLAMKGVFPKKELEELPATFKVVEVCALSVPEINAQRHLVRLRPRRAEED
jgi:16S rRNA (guanine527-N7)-methyltransferase